MKSLRTLIAAQTAISSQLSAICDSQDTGRFRGPAFSSARARIADRLARVEQLIAQHPLQDVTAERAHQQAESLRTQAAQLTADLLPYAASVSSEPLRAAHEALATARADALLPHLRRLRRFASDERELNADIRTHAQARVDAINASYAPRLDAARAALTEAQHAEREQHFANIAREHAAELIAEADALQAAHPDRPSRVRGADRGPRRGRATRPALPPDLHRRFEYKPQTGELLRTYRAAALVTGTHVKVRGVWYPVLEIIAALIGTNDRLTLRDVREPPALSNLLRSPKP